MQLSSSFYLYPFFFNDTATTEIYTLSLHDALPISRQRLHRGVVAHLLEDRAQSLAHLGIGRCIARHRPRSEEHTSELQSQSNLVCRLLLEKKKKQLKCTQGTIYTRHSVDLRVHTLT